MGHKIKFLKFDYYFSHLMLNNIYNFYLIIYDFNILKVNQKCQLYLVFF